MLNGLAFVTFYERELTNVSKSAARTRCIPVSTLVRVRKLLTSNITVYMYLCRPFRSAFVAPSLSLRTERPRSESCQTICHVKIAKIRVQIY